MPDSVKCQRCNFRGAQSDFPPKANLGYLKTCAACTQKRNKAAETRRLEKATSGTKRRALGKDKSSEGLPTIMWSAFTQLLRENKDSRFEIHAIVMMGDETPAVPSSSEDHAHVFALMLAKEVWNTTGFRFK
jgi:hypothetical protein